MRNYLSRYFLTFGRFSPFNRAENLAAFLSGSMLQAQGSAIPRFSRHVGPLSAAPSQYRARIFGCLVARLSRVPVVGPNFDPASLRVTHKFFFMLFAISRVRSWE